MEDNILKTQEDNISWLLIKLEKWWNTIISKECWYSTLGKGDNQNCFKKKRQGWKHKRKLLYQEIDKKKPKPV